ncbi:MAG: aminotransferase [Albidovulum sp.]|nr:aminotransferase [Albidovulum sp.]
MAEGYLDVDTDRAWACDHDHSLHPWTHFESFRAAGSQMVVSAGSGCRIEDSEGRSYLDAVGGLWCTNIGLGREDMAEAIAGQVRKLAYSSTFVDMTNGPAALLAAKIAELAPNGIERVMFSTGGSTAVDSAFRLAQFYQSCAGRPEKCHVIARENAYHGSTFASMSLGKRQGDRAPEFRYLTEIVHHVSAPNSYRRPPGVSEEDFVDWLVREFEDKISEIGADRVGAFFAEPVMGSGGVIVPPDGYMERIWRTCQMHDILFVADEVVTAFGRLGHWFACESEFGVTPDIVCSAKGLSSGYLPIGATLYSKQIHDVISHGDPERMYTSGFTYSGHPVCCMAALKNIEILEKEGILENASRVGSYFEKRLAELLELPIVGDVRGRKLMMCVESVMNKETKELFPREVNIGKRITGICEDLGLIVRPLGHLNIMSPPLILTETDVDFIVDALGEAIRRVSDDLAREGKF